VSCRQGKTWPRVSMSLAWFQEIVSCFHKQRCALCVAFCITPTRFRRYYWNTTTRPPTPYSFASMNVVHRFFSLVMTPQGETIRGGTNGAGLFEAHAVACPWAVQSGSRLHTPDSYALTANQSRGGVLMSPSCAVESHVRSILTK
jgi:hypothetical protein